MAPDLAAVSCLISEVLRFKNPAVLQLLMISVRAPLPVQEAGRGDPETPALVSLCQSMLMNHLHKLLLSQSH